MPSIIAGPIVRHCDEKNVTFWLVTTSDVPLRFCLLTRENQAPFFNAVLDDKQLTSVQIGHRAFIRLISINFSESLPTDTPLSYDIKIVEAHEEQGLAITVPHLFYGENNLPWFVIKQHIDNMLHGSCRKPHYRAGDGLLQVDAILAQANNNVADTPSLLMMSGDQVYVDDVAGPMLVAIHQVIELLGLFEECWSHDGVHTSKELLKSSQCYYLRDQILPHNTVNVSWFDKFFGASKTPIFTSVNAKNHLVTLSEIMAMYLLTWSSQLWQFLQLEQPKSLGIPTDYIELYNKELLEVEAFSSGLNQVQRALAHVPVYMIFDDHDITDDWNLTRGWEEAAYGEPFSKQIIGNALIGYWLCQGWGNAPDKFTQLLEQSAACFSEQGYKNHHDLIETLLGWDQWHYHLTTSPKIVVLDTRTQRWRSESNAGKPSGLMDWESLSALQQELIGHDSVIMVSAAPIYGVKFIETLQRVVTFFGKPLAVDAENWMAHSGTANVMLNIFRHHKTPPNFIILSGDVHYSFVYEVTHRFRRSSSKILQITCSGIKNEFPPKLLHMLERLNRYLYATYSPLNWFTKRRQMKIRVRKPQVTTDTSLFNGSGIGRIFIDKENKDVDAELITSAGKRVIFKDIE